MTKYFLKRFQRVHAVGFVIIVINELTEYLKIFSADLLLINALIVIRYFLIMNYARAELICKIGFLLNLVLLVQIRSEVD